MSTTWEPYPAEHHDAEWRDLALDGFWAIITPRTPTIASPGTYRWSVIRTSTGLPVTAGTALRRDHAMRQVRGWERHCLANPDAAPRP